ncbi:hypothetical protein Tco_0090754 [Tanacetum coccineum]
MNLPTSTSIFLAILTGYWNDQSANLTLILVGLTVLRDSFAYKEYDIRLMRAPRLAKALQEKVLLKLHGIRKLLGSQFGWNFILDHCRTFIAQKSGRNLFDFVFVSYEFFKKFAIVRHW